uniref:RRM domain-containing protein n=1 Tax=Kalanchoe fedtschenkoi TaxID=63787 RepID=A0A7N0TSK2_KALFE
MISGAEITCTSFFIECTYSACASYCTSKSSPNKQYMPQCCSAKSPNKYDMPECRTENLNKCCCVPKPILAVPPSAVPPTNSLKIDRFVRPFTMKAVQELLGKTGKVTSLWMDHIKTHCYVTYSSVEEAIETRNAVYNLQWPTTNGGGPLLVADFVDPQEVKNRLQAPAPVTAQPAAPTKQRQQQAPPPASYPPPPQLSVPPPARALTPPPPLPEKLDSPIVTLDDDLFRKTTTYLPLSELDQVAEKLAARDENNKA